MKTDKEEIKEKEAIRESIMTDKEIIEAEKYLNWYRNAHQDKIQQNLFNKWEEVESYWEGDLGDPTDETDPNSNTNIVNSNVEGKVALLVDQNIDIQVDPIEPSDRNFCNRVRIIADFIKDKNKMYRKIDQHERRREKYRNWNF